MATSKKKVSKKKSSKKEEKQAPERKYAGVTSGMRLTEWFTHTFKANFKSKHDDETLARMTREEFPMGKEYGPGDMKTARGRYNKGVLLKNQDEIHVPTKPLPEFDAEGNPKPIRGSKKEAEEADEEAAPTKGKKKRSSKKS